MFANFFSNSLKTVIENSLTSLASPAAVGTILLVDDDDAVRGYCQQVLELFGWRVQPAESASAALEIAAIHGEPLRLLMTDVLMPGMNGRELADRLLARQPDLRVLFISGFHSDEVLQAGIEEDRVYFLAKPFKPSCLLAKLREIMG